MNNLKLAFFTLFLLFVIAVIHFKKGPLYALFPEGGGNFTTQVHGKSFPKKLIDATGITSTLIKPPKRILSATLLSDHILSALIDPTRLVAVSYYVDQPSLSNIVNFYDPAIARTQGEIESMLALRPDLVFVASYSNPETVRYLLRSGIAVVRISEFNSFADIIANIRLLANVTDTSKKAQKLIEDIELRLAFVKQQVSGLSKKRVLYYGLDGYSSGGNSLMDETIRISGGINITAGAMPDGQHKIREELAISLQPDVIIMNKSVFTEQNNQQSPAQILKNKRAWKDVPAVKNNQVYMIPGTWLRSISQHRIKGVEALAKILHPQIESYHESISAN